MFVRAKVFHKTLKETFEEARLYVIFQLKNGTTCSIDMDADTAPDNAIITPNSRNVFKYFNYVDIAPIDKTIIPESMIKSLTISSYCDSHGICYYSSFSTPIKEKVMNEFIAANGGINTEKFLADIYNKK